MKTEQELRKSIMRRVYGIYLMRKLTSPTARLAVLAVGFLVIASSVSLPHVFQNALHASGVVGFVNFWVVALAGTTPAVQLSAVFALAVIIWTTRDLLQGSQNMTLAA